MVETMAEAHYAEWEKVDSRFDEVVKLLEAMRWNRNPSRDNENRKLAEKAIKICKERKP